MPKFDVLIERKTWERAVVQIDAETQEKATEMTESEDFFDLSEDFEWKWIDEEEDVLKVTEAE